MPGIKVLLANGKTKPIEKVKLGDKVKVTDPKRGGTTVREVVGTIVTEDDKHFVDLTIKGKSGKDENLVSTTTHPFWVESEKAWVAAGDLEPGMRLHTADGGAVQIVVMRSQVVVVQEVLLRLMCSPRVRQRHSDDIGAGRVSGLPQADDGVLADSGTRLGVNRRAVVRHRDRRMPLLPVLLAEQ
ncbi:polymorphic toxin-type HINT domain-containing protein [Streptomyces sp. NPDC005195]|uniref:polymorphic toxin-type HINT domain-containing protein n=1 Tax=Streptomyces sp. NPDC005195 TaxID=3154561 RepID=UPI0033A15D19